MSRFHVLHRLAVIGSVCIISLFVKLAVSTPAPAQSGPAKYQIKVGEAHPDFMLPRIDNGEPLKLSDYRGKKVLLVHFASW